MRCEKYLQGFKTHHFNQLGQKNVGHFGTIITLKKIFNGKIRLFSLKSHFLHNFLPFYFLIVTLEIWNGWLSFHCWLQNSIKAKTVQNPVSTCHCSWSKQTKNSWLLRLQMLYWSSLIRFLVSRHQLDFFFSWSCQIRADTEHLRGWINRFCHAAKRKNYLHKVCCFVF